MKHQTSKIISAAFFVLLILSVIAVPALAATPQQTLNQYIAGLHTNPNDYALREKIIKHVQTMKPKPTVAEEAERFMARGTAAVKNAKDSNDFKDAVNEFEKATLAAPWLASAYYNLGIAQDKAGRYPDAIKSLKLYLLASPNASDAKAVKNLIYEIEYKQDKAAKESVEVKQAQQGNAEAKKAREQEEFLRKINGARYICRNSSKPLRLIIQGSSVTMEGYGTYFGKEGWGREPISYEIEGRSLRCFIDRFPGPGRDANSELTGFISDDGSTITVSRKGLNEQVYNRDR